MRILFILSSFGAASWKMYYAEGIASLSAMLKKHGHKTDLFLVENEKDVKKLLQYIEIHKSQIIAFSFTEVQYKGVQKIARLIKQKFPNIFIICGGVHCILSPNEVVRNRAVDAVCIGEGENAIVELADSLTNQREIRKIKNLWIRRDKRVSKNPFSGSLDINSLPPPDREIFHQKNLGYYRGPIWLKKDQKSGSFLMSRGCIFNCHHCSSPLLNKIYGRNYYRLLNPQKGIAQIKKAVKKYKYDYLVFVDDTFTLNKKWLYKFLALYKKEVKIPFNCQTRIGTFDYKTMKKLKLAGCYLVMLGLESGNEAIREAVLNRKISNEEIKQGVTWVKKAGLKVATYNMLGLPTETPGKFKQTLLLNAALQPDASYFFIFYPYKRSKLYKFCQQKKLLKKKISKNFTAREDTILNLRNFKRKDILYYFNHSQRLLSLLKPTKNSLVNIYNKTLFNLHFVPPSSFFFKFSQNTIHALKLLKKAIKSCP